MIAPTPSVRRCAVLVALAAVSLLLPFSATAQEGDDPWTPVRPLLGRWTGEGSGFGAVSEVAHRWDKVLSDNFLRLRTRSVTRQEDGAGEVHEDVGFLSYDTDRSVFVFRQFLSEGFVNTFDVSVESGDSPTIVFGPRESESAGGMRAQMRLTFLTPSSYEMVLDLAAPGKDFSPCQRMHMKRDH